MIDNWEQVCARAIGESPFEPASIGHEFVGAVEDVGNDVHGRANGDLVIAPTAHCERGLDRGRDPGEA